MTDRSEYSFVGSLQELSLQNGAKLVWANDRVRGTGVMALPDEIRIPLLAAVGVDLPEDFEDPKTGKLVPVRSANNVVRAMSRMVRAKTQAERELLTLRVAFWGALPVTSTMVLEIPGRPQFIATTSRHTYEQARARGQIVLAARELEACAIAVGMGRLVPSQFAGWMANKDKGDWIITHARAGSVGMAGFREGHTESTACFGELFDAIGAELVSFEFEGAPPAMARKESA
jgi:hypothetical protein